MSSEEEVVKMQKILAASALLIVLSVGIAGFETFETWYQIDVEETSTDYDNWDISQDDQLKFSLEGLEIEWSRTTDYNDGSELSSNSGSENLDYGEEGVFEESESQMANVQRGGYVALALILFIIWKLQEMKTETSEEVREETIIQIKNVLKGAGALVALILLYYLSGAGLEEDFDALYIGETNGDYYSSYFSIDCKAAWINKPEFGWSGDSKFKYDDADCPDNNYPISGSGKMDFSLKLGFFAFAGSLIPLYFVFNRINLNQNFASFSVPSVPNIPNQGQEIKPYSPFKENKVEPYKTNEQTVYNQPEVSTIAIPEDEDD